MTASTHGHGRLSLWLAPWCVLAALVAACVVPSVAHASSSDVWSGNGDGSSWSDAQNWQSMTVPANGDSVTIAPTAKQVRPHVTGMPAGTDLQDLTLTDASLSGGDVTVEGSFDWTATFSFESLAAPLTVVGNASFSGAGELDSQDPMTFEGTTDIAGPGLLSIQDSGPAITNSGTLTLEPNVSVRGSVCCVNPDVFLNTGTVSLSGAGTATLGFMGFNDQGSVITPPGGLIDVIGGPGSFGTGSHISGGGTLQFDMGAAITLASSVSIAAGTTVALTGNAEFFGPGSFTGSGKFSWSGGTIDGSLDVASTIHTSLSGTATKQMMSTSPSTPSLLAFHGPTTVTGSGPLETFHANVSTSGAFTLKAGAKVSASTCCVNADEFLNTGTLIVPASTSGTASIAFMNFADQGPVSVGTGSTLHVTAGPGSFSPAVAITGGGTLDFDSNDQMTLASNISIGAGTTLLQTGGATFTGPGSFTGTGSYAWSGGTVTGNLDVASTITTAISGTATKNITSPNSTPTALTLRGATTVSGTGEVELSGTTTLNNLGTMTLQTGATIGASVCCAAPDTFRNSGTLVVAAGTGTATTTNMAFTNSGAVRVTSGTFSIGTLSYKQTAGSTQLAGGSITAAKQINIAGGTLGGFGKITGSLQSSGTVNPSTTGGVLSLTGAYKQNSTGVLFSVITGTTPGTKFGQFSVGGKATLAGTLKVNTGNGFVPTHGQSFPVLLYNSRAGTFTTVTGSPSFSVSYTATAANVVYP